MPSTNPRFGDGDRILVKPYFNNLLVQFVCTERRVWNRSIFCTHCSIDPLPRPSGTFSHKCCNLGCRKKVKEVNESYSSNALCHLPDTCRSASHGPDGWLLVACCVGFSVVVVVLLGGSVASVVAIAGLGFEFWSPSFNCVGDWGSERIGDMTGPPRVSSIFGRSGLKPFCGCDTMKGRLRKGIFNLKSGFCMPGCIKPGGRFGWLGGKIG